MRLTLNKSWELCLKQWAWIAKQIRAGDDRYINTIKEAWLKEKGFKNIYADCFFCEYTYPSKSGCNVCPGRKIDKTFDCENIEYDYENKPLKFYAKLKELNRKRMKK